MKLRPYKCPNCGFENKLKSSSICQICHQELFTKVEQENTSKESSSSLKGKNGGEYIRVKAFFPKVKSFVKKRGKKNQIIGVILGLLAASFLGYQILDNTSLNSKPKKNLESNLIRVKKKMIEVNGVPQGIFNYGGSICFAALNREGLNQTMTTVHPQFILRYVELKNKPGCGGDIEPLLSREISFIHKIGALTFDDYQLARQRETEIESIPIAIDGVAVYTHKSLEVQPISLTQLQDIFEGKITNWQQIGGIKLPITVIALEGDIESNLELLEISKITESAKMVRDYTTAIREVAKTPGAISTASAAILSSQTSIRTIPIKKEAGAIAISSLLADGRVNLPALAENTYPLTRKLHVVIRRDGSIEEKVGIAYLNLLLSEEGQKIVEQAGFVPLD